MRMFQRLTGWVVMGAAAMASTGCIIVDIEDGEETIEIRRHVFDNVEWEFDLLEVHSSDDGNEQVIKFLNITPVKVVDIERHRDSLDLNFVHTHFGGDLASVYQRTRDGSDSWWTLADVDLFGNDLVSLIEVEKSEDSSVYEIGDLDFFDADIATVLETSFTPDGNELTLADVSVLGLAEATLLDFDGDEEGVEFDLVELELFHSDLAMLLSIETAPEESEITLADVSVLGLAEATLLDYEADEEGVEFDLVELELFDSDLAKLLSIETSPEESEFTLVELSLFDWELFEGISAEAGEDFHEFTFVEALCVTLFECEIEGEELEWALVDADLPIIPFGLMEYETDGEDEVEFGFLRLPLIGTLFRYEADSEGTRIRSLFGSRISW